MDNVIQFQKYKEDKQKLEVEPVSQVEEITIEEQISNEIFESIVEVMEEYDAFFPYDESFKDLVMIQESINSYLLRLNNKPHALQDLVDDTVVVVQNDK